MTASDPKAGHCLYVYSYSAKDSASQGASSHSTVLTYDHLELIDFPLAAAVKINQCIISNSQFKSIYIPLQSDQPIFH
jgi:hypothetical protein